MPDENILTLLAGVNTTLQHLHLDFKTSMHLLIDMLSKILFESIHNVATATATNASVATAPNASQSQIDLFPTQSQEQRQTTSNRDVQHLVFPSDTERDKEKFDHKIKQHIESVKANWKKLVNSFSQNTHKSLRNSNLSTLYREWLQKDTPFVAKVFRPTPSNPPNAEIDNIRRQQSFARVEAQCKEMDLYAKSAQNNLEDVEKQIKELIENLTSDGKEREALSRQWNSDKIDAEQRKIKKWEKKI